MSLLFASLSVASRLFLGAWDFEGAAGIACLCAVAGTYLYLRGRRASRPIADPATTLDLAIRHAQSGRVDEAVELLTEAIRLSPQLWQAFQYRGELYLIQPNRADAALQDFTEAIRLAPEEPHLYILRGHAQSLLGQAAPPVT